MVTQFGYIAVWSIIWPLAPVFALINDYVELRSDAIKICNHVQRPVGERVESIGPWLTMLVSTPHETDPGPRLILFAVVHQLGSVRHQRHADVSLPTEL